MARNFRIIFFHLFVNRRASLPACWPLALPSLQLRPISSKICLPKPKANFYTSNYLKNSPNKQLFSHLEPSYFTLPARTHRHLLAIDTTGLWVSATRKAWQSSLTSDSAVGWVKLLSDPLCPWGSLALVFQHGAPELLACRTCTGRTVSGTIFPSTKQSTALAAYHGHIFPCLVLKLPEPRPSTLRAAPWSTALDTRRFNPMDCW